MNVTFAATKDFQNRKPKPLNVIPSKRNKNHLSKRKRKESKDNAFLNRSPNNQSFQ
jgi:hypothetical protein